MAATRDDFPFEIIAFAGAGAVVRMSRLSASRLKKALRNRGRFQAISRSWPPDR
jgi:hypothetical protein